MQRTTLHLVGLVALSFAVNILQVPILHGTFGALVLAVLTQVYLPGYLLARRLGRHQLSHPIHRFGWILACGLGLSIVLAAPFRLFEQPIPVYLSMLHIIMFILALWSAGYPELDEPKWFWSRDKLPGFALVALCSVIAMGVSYESRHRFYGFEDQPLFISYIDWLVHHPGERPIPETPLRTRQVAVLSNDSRMDTDGWTYTHAAWSWSSGVGGSQLIWYDLATLFIWAVPLITFALAYELTRKESVAVFSTVSLILAGLMTLDNLVYAPSYIAYGRFVLFQINVPRQASLTLTLPLAILCTFAYLRTNERRDLIPMSLTAFAVAIMHPIQYMILLVSIGAIVLARFLATPRWNTLRRLIPMGIILMLILALPYVQRTIRIANVNEDVLTIVRPELVENPRSLANQYFVMLPELPLVGQTYVRRPETVFYNPIITLAVILALLHGLKWRANPAHQYAFAITLLALILFFTPGLTRLFDRFVSSVGVLTAIFTIPVALIYGLAVDDFMTWAKRYLGRYLQPMLMGLAALSSLILLLEPFPMASSARDQLVAYNAMQEPRRMLPSQEAVSQAIVAMLPIDEISIVATPRDIANFMIEDSADVLITGGRSNANRAIAANDRFFTEGSTNSPWLDSEDLEFLNQWNVTHIVALSDWTRLAQIYLQPERFQLLSEVDGYVIFRPPADLTPDSIDERFSYMNKLYSARPIARWSRNGFSLALPGSPEIWLPVVADWQNLLEDSPDDDRVRLGLAFAQTLAGDDLGAVNTWDELHRRYPNTPLYADALASTLAQLGLRDAITPLVESLNSPVDYSRVLAARRLLTETFFYRLDDSVLEHVIAITTKDIFTWNRLAEFDQPDSIRLRAGLMFYRGHLDEAVTWLQRIPRIQLAPEDLTVIAAANLTQGNIEGALSTLLPATDPDWVYTNAKLHPERWEENTAAEMYYQLVQGRQISPEQLPEDHPLRLLSGPSLYVLHPQIELTNDDRTLLVTATFGNFSPRSMFRIQTWRIYVVSDDGMVEYALLDTPAEYTNGLLTRTMIELPLPDNLPLLTNAQVIIEPRHNNAVTVKPLRQHIVLNRPEAAELPSTVISENIQFGNAISLEGTSIQVTNSVITIDLYWKANSSIGEDYQVFIHVFDAAGNRVTQLDSSPVNGRYPTSQWRTNTLIADTYELALDNALQGSEYNVRIGLYRLSDGTRLPITQADPRVQDDSLLIGTFGN